MSRTLLLAAIGVLLLAGGALIRPRRGHVTTAPEPAVEQDGKKIEIKRLFPTAEDARRYAVARLWASEGTSFAGDPYSSTFTRRFSPLTGEPVDYYLIEDPARELDLAEGFLEHGFAREALAHFDALITFHPDSPEAARAKSRVELCRKATVLGLVSPLGVVIEDGAGMRYVPAAVERAEPPTLERIQEAWLGLPVRVADPVRVVGFVDDAGTVVPPGAAPEGIFMPNAPQGAVSTTRSYYRLRRVGSLFELEALVKKEFLLDLAERTDTSDPGNLSTVRRIADALLYGGCREEATSLLARIEEAPPEIPADA